MTVVVFMPAALRAAQTLPSASPRVRPLGCTLAAFVARRAMFGARTACSSPLTQLSYGRITRFQTGGEGGITRRSAPRPSGRRRFAAAFPAPASPAPGRTLFLGGFEPANLDLSTDTPSGHRLKDGGEGGIRTLEGLLTLTPLAGERFRPLSHLSVLCILADLLSFCPTAGRDYSSPLAPRPSGQHRFATLLASMPAASRDRTLEGLLTLTPLAGERFRPLSHLSVTFPKPM
jgi:hypothetical protein